MKRAAEENESSGGGAGGMSLMDDMDFGDGGGGSGGGGDSAASTQGISSQRLAYLFPGDVLSDCGCVYSWQGRSRSFEVVW